MSLKHKIDVNEDVATSSPRRKRRRLSKALNHCPASSTTATATADQDSAASVKDSGAVSGLTGSPRQARLSVREAMGQIDYLSKSAMAESRIEPEKLSSGPLSLYSLLASALSLNCPDHSRSGAQEWSLPQVQIDGTELPRKPLHLCRENTVSYMQYYTTHICPRYPHLSRSRSIEEYEAVVSEQSRTEQSDPQFSKAGDVEYFNAYLGLAIGILVSPSASLLQSLVANLHSAARQVLPNILSRQGGHLAIRCMLLLAIFSIYSPLGGSSWHLVGLIMQKCIFLGLDKETVPQEVIPESDAVERRKLFWSAYLLDRYDIVYP